MTLIRFILIFTISLYTVYAQNDCNCNYTTTIETFENLDYKIEYLIGTCVYNGETIQTIKIQSVTLKDERIEALLTVGLSNREKFRRILKHFISKNPLNTILGSYNFVVNKFGVDYGGCWEYEILNNETQDPVEHFSKCETDICCVQYFQHYLTECDQPVLFHLSQKDNVDNHICPPENSCTLYCGDLNE